MQGRYEGETMKKLQPPERGVNATLYLSRSRHTLFDIDSLSWILSLIALLKLLIQVSAFYLSFACS
jgi:hypothetical protein